MTYLEALLALLLSQPAFWLERPDPTREARLAQVASELAAFHPEIAAALVVQGQAESGFARYVADGCVNVPRKASDCDRGRARGYWQQWRAQCPGAYRYAAGTPESLHEEAHCVARRWRWHLAGAGRHAGFPAGRWRVYQATLARLRGMTQR